VSVPLVRSAANGCYDAGRAAALSGVPKTTVYWWARKGIVVPSVSPVQEKLWSYEDLMALRIVSWLRHNKPTDDGSLPASPMPMVRRAMSILDELGLDLWSPAVEDESPLLVAPSGEIFVRYGSEVQNLYGQPAILPDQTFGLTAPFGIEGGRGPNLLRPRPHLRIVPSKVAGEPHLEHSRLTTQTVAALADRGYGAEVIASMYDASVDAVQEGIELERELSGISSAA
jgi:uncharacterized protein (DUF433 family)